MSISPDPPRVPPGAAGPIALGPVTVLLALHQGEAHLQAQLDSIAAQEGVDWRLVVSDDGSTDEGPAILDGFAARWPGRVRRIDGPCRGSNANFLHLLAEAASDSAADTGPSGRAWALADQDDVWLPDKLARGAAALAAVPAGRPALYAAGVVHCDADLRPIGRTGRRRTHPDFANALIQNVAPGHTMMINRAALDRAVSVLPDPDRIIVHDWWLYQVVTAVGGPVIFDPKPASLYRQHGANQIGQPRGLALQRQRWRRLWNDDLARWNRATRDSLAPLLPDMPPHEAAIYRAFDAMPGADLFARIRLMRAAGLHRDTAVGQIGLWVAVLTGKV